MSNDFPSTAAIGPVESTGTRAPSSECRKNGLSAIHACLLIARGSAY